MKRQNRRNRSNAKTQHNQNYTRTEERSNLTREYAYRKVKEFSPLNEKQAQYLDLLESSQIIIAVGDPRNW